MDSGRFEVEPSVPGAVRRIPFDLVVNRFGRSPVCPPRLRPLLLRVFGADIGRGVQLRRDVDIFGPKLTLGRGVFVNVGAMLNNSARITIGAATAIGPRAVLTTTSHEVGDHARRAGSLKVAPIEIGAGCWIGAGAIVLPGVIIGPGCIVAAGSVVTSDLAADGMYAGIPARRVRDLGL